MTTAFIGLGSNLDDPVQQVNKALHALKGLPKTRLIGRSPLYSSPPLGGMDQPDYVNAVAALDTSLSPSELLAKLVAIENAQGRVRGEKWGPRSLDLDILLYGNKTLKTPELTIPHPGLYERNFVLYPLADVVAQAGLTVEIPGSKTLVELLDACDWGGLEMIDDTGMD